MIRKILFTLLFCKVLFAEDMITLLPYKSNEFSPALHQTIAIPFTLSCPSDIKIEIYTPDNNLIRTLHALGLKKGENKLIWDGKDDQGTVVPDEAYSIAITAKSKEGNQTIDFRYTGGMVLKDLHTKTNKLGLIRYKLSSPARVLVRAGIENGPMLRMISNWTPKNKGLVRQKWDMKDTDNLVDIATLPFGITVSAFSLPKHAILTTNNKSLDYYHYFNHKHFQCHTLPLSKQLLKRGEEAISKHAYACRIQDRDPRLSMTIDAPKNDQNLSMLENGKAVNIKVSMHPEDEALLEKAKYEVSFFVDFEFTSEEELGFMPISWNYMPNGLRKGEHILTVNVSSFTGQVGLKSYKFILK